MPGWHCRHAMLHRRQCSPTSALIWHRSNVVHAVLSRTVPRITIVFSFGILLGDFSVLFFLVCLFSVGHSSRVNPCVAIACRFFGDSSRCDPWSSLVVSDLVPQHPCMPSPTVAVLAHLHMHGQRSGVELKLDGGRETAQPHEHTKVGYC